MAKPICLIKWNDDRAVNNSGLKPSINDLFESFSNILPDYNVLVTFSNIEDLYEVQVFYDKDFTEIEYSELKELIINKIKDAKTTITG